MFEWIEPNEEDERFISNPGFSEDHEPDPEFAGLLWDGPDGIEQTLWEYEQEMRLMEAVWRFEHDAGY